MTDRSNLGRRQYVKSISALSAIGVSGLAGCGGQGSTDNTTEENEDTSGGEATEGGDGNTGSQTDSHEVQQAVNLRMSSFVEGTGWYVMAGAMGEQIKPNLPSGSQISVLPQGGNIGSIKLMAEEKVDIGLNSPVAAKWAREGTHTFDQKYPDLRGLVGHLDTYWQLVAAREGFGYSSFEELKEDQPAIKLGAGPAGGAANATSRLTFEAHGITYDDIRSWGGEIIRMGLGDTPSAMQSGDIDMMGWVATPGHPVWTQIANDVGLEFFEVSDEARPDLTDVGLLDMPDMPEGMFGASESASTVGWRTMLFTDTRLSENVAYQIVKSAIESSDEIASTYSGMEAFDPEKGATQKYLQMPLHPGAEEYLADEGYL